MMHSGPVISERDGLRVIACRKCAFAHLDPLPTEAELSDYYRDTFWSVDKSEWLSKYKAERDYHAERFSDWLTMVENTIIGRTLLDVGSGYGFFLKAAHDRNWGAWGIEPNKAAVDYCDPDRNFVWNGTWDTAIASMDDKNSKAKVSYDCISALWLLEHLPNPCAFLAWVKAHLYSGGALLLAVPNEYSHMQSRANTIAKVKDYFVHKTHCNYFSAASLYHLLGRAGFRVVDAMATYPMETFIVEGKDYTDYAAHPGLGAECHKSIREMEMMIASETRREFYRQQARIGLGRDLIVVAVPE